MDLQNSFTDDDEEEDESRSCGAHQVADKQETTPSRHLRSAVRLVSAVAAMSDFVDNEVEEASGGEEGSEGEERPDQVRTGSKKKSGGKNRSRVIDSSDEDEDDGESGLCHCVVPHAAVPYQTRTSSKRR